MKLSEFKRQLDEHPQHQLCFLMPDEEEIPAHAHVTEIGRVDKVFMDCGGTIRKLSCCSLQSWASDADLEHRLSPQRLAEIIEKALPIFRGDDLDVEIEYEDLCILSQYPVVGAINEKGVLKFTLTSKHTDCLAKEICLPRCCSTENGGCC